MNYIMLMILNEMTAEYWAPIPDSCNNKRIPRITPASSTEHCAVSISYLLKFTLMIYIVFLCWPKPIPAINEMFTSMTDLVPS